MGFALGEVVASLSASQGLGIAASVAGLMLVSLARLLASVWCYGRWEARRRPDADAGSEPVPGA